MKRRILVADDEPTTAEMLALIFGFTGYEVTRAYDGIEALELAKTEKPDVLLLDVRMPGLCGSDVARRIKADPELADQIVVLISAADEGDVRWQEVGADAFLSKPVELRELPTVVDDLLSRRERRN